MFDPTKPYCRRDGKSAKIVYGFEDGSYLVVYKPYDGSNYEHYYRVLSVGTLTGCAVVSPGNYDLINIPKKIEGWVCVTKYMVYPTVEEANKCAHASNRSYDACIKVSFTEREGLSDD